ncbi:ROK family transcriptional regulator [Nonomuraea wenchangensis]|uniref:Sugar kinase of the NBD/HSP70 family, may contain an N-terminal HTH domain n=1 Tax=Nonomuraea wenchangensis TaxID=568860 RepID=A0A1I0K1G2_9ACTN|nr:ROK family transcriptional regulator [Nonomuraea wenchangensis]SEU16711.1 Sugar kinase of the NBD/HSP70 family, may contain an N-terminal HTH domain [Nonomuraea wenchangensis]
MSRSPGVPRLLRRLNDRAALELLLVDGPLTRAELGERTGLSKVTAGQLLARLEERGLVEVAGERAGGRGPHAALYGVVPSSAYVAGLEVLPDSLKVGVADITGRIVVEITVNPADGGDPVRTVHAAVQRACDTAGIGLERLKSFVIGTRGVVDPVSGDVRWSYDLPAWHVGVLASLRRTLGASVTIENDVNLVALAEHTYGAAVGHDDFVVIWAGVGQGLGVMLDGRLHRGITGGAGEIGWLPVPGEPLPADVSQPQSGSFQRLVGHDALRGLAREHGVQGVTVPDLVRGGGEDFLDAVAARLAVGAAAITVVLDPGLIVLSGDVGRAGGERLAAKVQEAVARVCPSRPPVVTTTVAGNPVLRGALVAALDQAREQVFSDTV